MERTTRVRLNSPPGRLLLYVVNCTLRKLELHVMSPTGIREFQINAVLQQDIRACSRVERAWTGKVRSATWMRDIAQLIQKLGKK